MTKLLGVLFAAVLLTLGFGNPARAQLSASAVALTAGNYLTLDGLTITVKSVICDDGGVSCTNLFLAPTSGPGASVIIEAAMGNTVGSSLQPIFSYTCPSTGSCGTDNYDMSVTLNVAAKSSTLTGVAGTLNGSVTVGNSNDTVASFRVERHLGRDRHSRRQ